MWAWSRGRSRKRDGNEPQSAGRRAEAHAWVGVGVFGSVGFSPRGFCLGFVSVVFCDCVPGLKPRLRLGGLVGVFGSVGFSPLGWCLGLVSVVFCGCVPGLKPRLRLGLGGAFGSVGFSPLGWCLGFGCVVFWGVVPGLKPRLRAEWEGAVGPCPVARMSVHGSVL